MFGVEGTKTLLVAHLEEHLPATITQLEESSLRAIGAPVTFRGWAGQQLAASELPAVEVVAFGWSVVRHLGITEFGVEQVEVAYRYRVFTTSRGENFEDTTNRRDDLNTALFLTLIAWQQLRDAAGAALPAHVDPMSLSSTPSTIERIGPNSPALIAAAYTDLTVRVEETVAIDPLGTAVTITVAEHPGLT